MRSFLMPFAATLVAITTTGAEAGRRSSPHVIDCTMHGCLKVAAARAPRPAPEGARARHHRAKPAKVRKPVSPLIPASAPKLERERGGWAQAQTPAPIGVVAKLEAQVDKPLGIMVDKARLYLGKTARELGLPNDLWCSDFVNMITGGGTRDRMARSWLARPRMDQPELGAIVVFWRRSPNSKSGHVGVLVGWDKRGNPIAVTGNSGGNRVREGRYDKRRVLAYVMPPLPRPQGLLEAGGPWASAAGAA